MASDRPMPNHDRSSIETRPNFPLPIRSGVERRPVVLAAAAILFAAVFVLRELGSAPVDGRDLLYVVPVALIALELGLVAGLVAAGIATGLVMAWNLSSDADLGAAGILSRAVVFASIGLIAGRFSDRMRLAGAFQERLLDSGLELAREHEEVGLDRRKEELATGLVEERSGRRLSAQDRAGLAIMDLQAEAVRENLSLLERERRQARQLQLVFEGQENERRSLAHELHEEAAQALAAVLLGLDALARDSTGDSARRVRAVREQVDLTLERCRQLAVGLRPPALDGIGLVPALGSLAELPDVERVTVDHELAAVELPTERETAVYRAVEEAVRRTAGPREAAIGLEQGGRELLVTVRSRATLATIGELGPLQARLDLLGGSLESRQEALVARIPLRSRPAAPVTP
jgi:signal transduction histidine kinase